MPNKESETEKSKMLARCFLLMKFLRIEFKTFELPPAESLTVNRLQLHPYPQELRTLLAEDSWDYREGTFRVGDCARFAWRLAQEDHHGKKFDEHRGTATLTHEILWKIQCELETNARQVIETLLSEEDHLLHQQRVNWRLEQALRVVQE